MRELGLGLSVWALESGTWVIKVGNQAHMNPKHQIQGHYAQ